MNKNEKNRLNHAVHRGCHEFILEMGKDRNHLLIFRIGKPLMPFLAFSVRARANGMSVGAGLGFLQISLNYADQFQADEPVLTFGFVWADRTFVVYTPVRHQLMGRPD